MTIPPFLAPGVIGVAVAFVLTPVIQWCATRLRIVDHPGGRRIHQAPTPRLGGIAVYLAFVIAVLVGLPVERSVSFSLQAGRAVITFPFLPAIDRPILGLLLGATLITILGLVDDIRGISPLAKLLGQIGAAMVVLPFGVGMDVLTNPLGGMVFVGPLGAVVTVVWLVALCNVMNLVDGIDGLAAGIAMIAVATLLIASFQRGDAGTAILAAAFMGGTLGFLPYNFNPARIFLGDAGSMLLGYVLGVLSVVGTYKSYTALSLLVPLAALGVPVADTALAIARRWRRGRPIFQADTEHLHHQLLRRGLSQRQTALVLYLITAILGSGALVLSGIHRFSLIAVVGLLLAALAVGARRTGLLPSTRRPVQSTGDLAD
jgi:UDP-GlcNAc:undecaprenyl-phosphate GlcNAc-1-phosphate transferase